MAYGQNEGGSQLSQRFERGKAGNFCDQVGFIVDCGSTMACLSGGFNRAPEGLARKAGDGNGCVSFNLDAFGKMKTLGNRRLRRRLQCVCVGSSGAKNLWPSSGVCFWRARARTER